jgi:hypothetical protein
MGVKGIAATVTLTSPYYTIQDIALRLVPTLSPLTLDPDPQTSGLTIQTLRLLLNSLEQNHEKMTTEKASPQNLESKSTETQTSQSVLGWAFSSLAKKVWELILSYPFLALHKSQFFFSIVLH